MRSIAIDCPDCAMDDVRHRRPHPQGRRHTKNDGTCETCGGVAWWPAGGSRFEQRRREQREQETA